MFQGFSPETIDFLWGIRMNNNREWFLEHKAQYTSTLYEPMKDLAREIFQPFQDVPGFLCKTSRIYRDMRMHHDTPYKESLWICMRRDSTWWMQEPSLFFELTPDDYSYGFLFFQPTVPMMDAMRRDMAEHPAGFLRRIRTVEKKTGIPVTGTRYTRKKPCPEPLVEDYYQLRNLTAYVTRPVSEELFTPALADTVKQALEGLFPLCTYCQQFTQPK